MFELFRYNLKNLHSFEIEYLKIYL